MEIQITVQVSSELACALRLGASRGLESQELLQTLEAHGIALEPLHPDAEDPFLTPYYTVEVPDAAKAEEVIAALRRSVAVEAAYIKPMDEPP
jgi:hypothetical protein